MTLQLKQQMTTQGVFQGMTQTMGMTVLSLIWARGMWENSQEDKKQEE